MKVCLVHNEYGKFSGEEAVFFSQKQLLEEQGHEVCQFTKSSREIDNSIWRQFHAFCSGIYNPFSVSKFRRFLKQQEPDLIHVHNLFPLISPAVLHVCKEFKLPVVMTLHNYRLLCPNGLFMVNGKVCEMCCSGKEYWCIIKNCEKKVLKSFGYALRNFVARTRKSYLNNVHIYAALTGFQRKKLIANGFHEKNIEVLPNMAFQHCDLNINSLGEYIGYVGRVSGEKGVDILVAAAEKCPPISFKAAGTYEDAEEIVRGAPENFQFYGHLARDVVDKFITSSRIIVLCSVWYEGFPMILVEAMSLGRPIIASCLGGVPEIVEDGVTGLLFEAGNPDDLAEKIQYLWEHPDLCRQMGKMGRLKAQKEYSPEKYYQRLIDVYEKAQKVCRNENITTI